MAIIRTDKELPERMPFDHYPTDRGLIKAALSRLMRNPYFILDAGSGSGRWGNVARELFPKAYIVGVELDDKWPFHPDYDEWVKCDFLEWQNMTNIKFDFIIGNPPYKYAEEFIRKAHSFARNNFDIMLLFKLAFISSKKRSLGLYKDLPLFRYDVTVPRPSFYGGGTNDDDYAIYWWNKSEGKMVHGLEYNGGWLHWTPIDKERRKHAKRA